MLYIGETKRGLADRYREALSAVRIHDGSSEVGDGHFSTYGHSSSDIQVTAFKQFRSDLTGRFF